MPLTHVYFDEIESTHLYISKLSDPELVVVADYQTGGRGQGSHRWESERGKNLLFSIRTQITGLEVKDRFVLSMAGALTLKDVLDKYLKPTDRLRGESEGEQPSETSSITLKWPNDIYWKDKKISGTLIITSLSGKKVKDCIYSVGVNLNQKVFLSDAPNPVSLIQIIGHEVNRENLLNEIIEAFQHYKQQIAEGKTDEIRQRYSASMYRREGLWPFEDATGIFKARILGVSQEGYLILQDQEGAQRTYEIKQLIYK